MSASKKSDLSLNIYFEIELIIEKTIEVLFTKLFWPTVIEKKVKGQNYTAIPYREITG